MAHTIPFDTHLYVKKLIAVGVSEAQAEVQAEAIAELVNEQLATKRDIEELRIATKRDLEEFELRLKNEITRLQLTLTLRLGALTTAAVAIVAVLVKLL